MSQVRREGPTQRERVKGLYCALKCIIERGGALCGGNHVNSHFDCFSLPPSSVSSPYRRKKQEKAIATGLRSASGESPSRDSSRRWRIFDQPDGQSNCPG